MRLAIINQKTCYKYSKFFGFDAVTSRTYLERVNSSIYRICCKPLFDIILYRCKTAIMSASSVVNQWGYNRKTIILLYGKSNDTIKTKFAFVFKVD